MKKLAFIIAFAAATFFCRLSFADECAPGPDIALDGRTGNLNSGDVMFSYGSYMERYSKFVHSFVWCIKANPNNQNVAEFRWGDAQNEGKYLSTLVLPGQPGSNSTSDASKKIVGEREINYRRKNRSQWGSIKVDTISSTKFGTLENTPRLLLTQSASPLQALVPELEHYKNQEGLLELDRLSSNKSLFLAVLNEQKQISIGGSFTVTLPTSQRVADLIQNNQYEKYEKDDFIATHAAFSSIIIYNDGHPIVLYVLSFRPDKADEYERLSRLLDDGQIQYKISASEQFTRFDVFTSREQTSLRSEALKEQLVGKIPLEDRSVQFSTAELDISFGKGASLATTTPSLVVPK